MDRGQIPRQKSIDGLMDSENYRPELVHTNRSRRYEQQLSRGEKL